jgi:hypothetical protein
MIAAPPSSSTALTIWTHVVANMPPSSRNVSMTTPTIATEASYGSPKIRSISVPAPTICAIK